MLETSAIAGWCCGTKKTRQPGNASPLRPRWSGIGSIHLLREHYGGRGRLVGRFEGRTALIQAPVDFLTASFAGMTGFIM